MNNTILITGASSGIGKATAQYFHSKGWNVIATMRNPNEEKELTALEKVLVLKLDVLDPSTIENAIHHSIQQFGKIDVLVNNAGYGAYGPLETFSREKIMRQFNTNVIGLIDVTKAVLPHFRNNQRGIIINVSSIGGKITFPLGSLYHGTKFAVEGISESLQYEVAAFGGKVKIIEPGAIATDFTSRSFEFSNDESIAEYQPLINTLQTGTAAMYQHALAPIGVAEVIYTAATDGSDQLRYTAGADAANLMALRTKLDDGTFFEAIKPQFGLKQ